MNIHNQYYKHPSSYKSEQQGYTYDRMKFQYIVSVPV